MSIAFEEVGVSVIINSRNDVEEDVESKKEEEKKPFEDVSGSSTGGESSAIVSSVMIGLEARGIMNKKERATFTKEDIAKLRKVLKAKTKSVESLKKKVEKVKQKKEALLKEAESSRLRQLNQIMKIVENCSNTYQQVLQKLCSYYC